jgi:hypothetical protein
MTYKKTLCFLIASIATANVSAQEKQSGIVGVNYFKHNGSDTTLDRGDFQFTNFWNSYERGSHPWIEAPYLERTSYVSLGAGFDKFDYESGGSSDGPRFGATGYFASKNHPFVGSIGYTYMSYSLNDDEATGSSEFNGYSASVGAFLTRTARILLRYSKYNADVQITLNGESYGQTYYTTAYSVGGKIVEKLADKWDLGFQIGYSKQETEYDEFPNYKSDSYYLLPTIHFLQRYSVGVGYSHSESDDNESKSDTYLINATAFLTKQFSLTLGYQESEDSSSYETNSSDAWNASVIWWF